MTLLSVGHQIWPSDSIISTETRKWLRIDDDRCKGATTNGQDSVQGGVRKLTNLSEQDQWLSMHQCIDVACPIHGNDKYEDPAGFVPGVCDEHLYRNDTQYTPCSETTTCRRQLFGEDDDITTGCESNQTLGYGRANDLRDTDAVKPVPVKKPIYALQQIANYYNDNEIQGVLATHKLAEHTYESANPGYKTSSKESRPAYKPAFMCTWLHDNVSIDKYPLYKLSIVCSNTVPEKRKEFGVFSTHVTDQLWSFHKYEGEMDVESLGQDKTSTYSCKKSRSLENYVNETIVSVLKDISDVDISDLKKKYSFLFDPKYIFRATNAMEHTGQVQTYDRSNDNGYSQYCKTGSDIVTRLPANSFVNGWNYDFGCVNNSSHLPLELTNIPVPPQNHSNNSSRFGSRIHTPSPVIAYGTVNNPGNVTVHFNSTLTDPRLHRTDIEAGGMNGNGLCLSVNSSPDMYRQREAELLTENSKYNMYNEWYGYESDESPYSTLPRRSPASNVTAPRVNTEHVLWRPEYRELKQLSSHSSPLNSGYNVSPRSPRERELSRKHNYHSIDENGDYSPLIQGSKVLCQSPLVQGCNVACYRDGQQRYQSTYKTNLNNDCGDSPLVHSTRCTLGGKRHRETFEGPRSRSNTPNDRSGSTRDRGRNTRRDAMDDRFSSEKRSNSYSRRITSSRHSQYDDRHQKTETNDSSSLRSYSKHVNGQHGDEIHNPIPQYLMSDGYTMDCFHNESPKGISRCRVRDDERVPSCGKLSSANRHSKHSSRDRSSPSDSWSHERMGDRKTKLKASEEDYVKDRQNRRTYRDRVYSKSSWNSRSRSRSRSSNGRRSETRDSARSSNGRRSATRDSARSSNGRRSATRDSARSSNGRRSATRDTARSSNGRRSETSDSARSSNGRRSETLDSARSPNGRHSETRDSARTKSTSNRSDKLSNEKCGSSTSRSRSSRTEYSRSADIRRITDNYRVRR